MYEKLVKRLRNLSGTDNIVEFDEAADAIEELCRAADAIPHVCECCIGCEVESGCGCDRAFVLSPKRAREYLSKPRWIPVTERLPESGVPTLICGDGNVVEQGFFDDEHGYWYDGRGYRTFVHHWMPLPKGPEEE